MTMAYCPHPYDIAAWAVSLMDPCTGKAIAGSQNGYVSIDTVQTFQFDPQFESGERMRKLGSRGHVCATKLLPKQFVNSTGNLGACMMHPELRAMLNGGELYVDDSLYTVGWSGGGANGELIPVWLQVWEFNDNGDCPADPDNAYDYTAHVYPYGYVMPVDGQMTNKAYREFTATTDFQALLPPDDYTGPFGDIPGGFFESFTKKDWHYAFYTDDLPTDSGCGLSSVAA